MNIGLDIHGVITSNPRFFSHFSTLAVERGHEVHIITGAMLSEGKIAELNSSSRVLKLWTIYPISGAVFSKNSSLGPSRFFVSKAY